MDEATFGELAARHRRELHVHCYQLLGSFHDAEDLVQETFARAWRSRHTFQGRSSERTWLYRIATNACLAHLRRHRRRPQPAGVVGEPTSTTPAGSVTWLQPYPDRLLDGAGPGEQAVARETIELAFLTAVQHLPPRQRAVLILRDVLGWPAEDTAAALETSVAAVKSALQRARATMRIHLPSRRENWQAPAPSGDEREVLRRYLRAHEAADPAALAALLREDVRMTMPPEPVWHLGRAAVVALWSSVMVGPGAWGQWRMLPTRANRQPAVAHYLRREAGAAYQPWNLDVLRIEDGLIVEITGFDAAVFTAFDLPTSM